MLGLRTIADRIWRWRERQTYRSMQQLDCDRLWDIGLTAGDLQELARLPSELDPAAEANRRRKLNSYNLRRKS